MPNPDQWMNCFQTAGQPMGCRSASWDLDGPVRLLAPKIRVHFSTIAGCIQNFNYCILSDILLNVLVTASEKGWAESLRVVELRNSFIWSLRPNRLHHPTPVSSWRPIYFLLERKIKDPSFRRNKRTSVSVLREVVGWIGLRLRIMKAVTNRRLVRMQTIRSTMDQWMS